MKKLKTGDIYREFKSRDEDTIVRRLNLRMYTKDAKIKYTVCQSKWLIDFDDLLNSLNPKGYTETKKLPRIRTKIGAQKEWNAEHRRKIKHHIIDCICDSGKVFVFKHGRTNIINYDELEQELIKILKERGQY
jgi:hypothetical protein